MIKIYTILLILSTLLSAADIKQFINKSNCDQIIDKHVYEICYDYKMKGALYVAYTLDGKKVNEGNIKKRPRFYTEKSLNNKYRSKYKDYTHSGYDRGHLANDASFDYNIKIVRKTYSMANIIPQAPKVNRNTWVKAEKLERQIAYRLGSVNVINGVIYNDSPKRIGKNRIAVPEAFWKMIYNDENGYKKCFYYENNNDINVKSDRLKNHQFDCRKLDNLYK